MIAPIAQGSKGVWMPFLKTITLDPSLVLTGTRNFLNILAHESIHVSQSCAAGSINKTPQRLGLPLDFSSLMNTRLNHPLYGESSKEGLYIEQEAYSYSAELGTAYYLLDQYCDLLNSTP